MIRLKGTMAPRRSISWLLTLLALGCSVDGGDPFMGVNSASGSATATATATASATDADASSGEGSGGTEATSSDESGSGEGTSASTGSGTSGSSTAPTPTTTGSTSSTSDTDVNTDSSSGGESSGGVADACGGMPLDAQLDVPPMCSPTCNAIGFGSDCPGIEICRLKDSQTAVCETCVPPACGNLHAPCTASSECDILFTCFMGQCTAMCDKTTPQTCGNPAACTEVGHPTHGVCNPNI